MHFLIGGVSLLALIGLAFGEAAMARTAQVVLCLLVLGTLFVAEELITHGAVMRFLLL